MNLVQEAAVTEAGVPILDTSFPLQLINPDQIKSQAELN